MVPVTRSDALWLIRVAARRRRGSKVGSFEMAVRRGRRHHEPNYGTV